MADVKSEKEAPAAARNRPRCASTAARSTWSCIHATTAAKSSAMGHAAAAAEKRPRRPDTRGPGFDAPPSLLAPTCRVEATRRVHTSTATVQTLMATVPATSKRKEGAGRKGLLLLLPPSPPIVTCNEHEEGEGRERLQVSVGQSGARGAAREREEPAQGIERGAQRGVERRGKGVCGRGPPQVCPRAGSVQQRDDSRRDALVRAVEGREDERARVHPGRGGQGSGREASNPLPLLPHSLLPRREEERDGGARPRGYNDARSARRHALRRHGQDERPEQPRVDGVAAVVK